MNKSKINTLNLHQPVDNDTNQYLRAKHMPKFLGVSKSTFYRLLDAGKFPTGLSLSARCIVWNINDIHKFMSGLSYDA